MKISDYDKADLVAQNENGDALYIVKWGTVYHYFLQYKGQEGFTTGESYASKQSCINNAYQFALSTFCNCFSYGDILGQYPEQKTITITQDEIVAINTALCILSYSNSDHADQAYYYLKKLSDKLK